MPEPKNIALTATMDISAGADAGDGKPAPAANEQVKEDDDEELPAAA